MSLPSHGVVVMWEETWWASGEGEYWRRHLGGKWRVGGEVSEGKAGGILLLDQDFIHAIYQHHPSDPMEAVSLIFYMFLPTHTARRFAASRSESPSTLFFLRAHLHTTSGPAHLRRPRDLEIDVGGIK